MKLEKNRMVLADGVLLGAYLKESGRMIDAMGLAD